MKATCQTNRWFRTKVLPFVVVKRKRSSDRRAGNNSIMLVTKGFRKHSDHGANAAHNNRFPLP